MENPLKKHPAVIVTIVLTIALLVIGFWPKPVPVETVAVQRGPMSVVIEEEGRTRVVDRYIISAPVNGVTCSINLDVGDRVEQGQALLFITPLESQVLDARSRAEAVARESRAESALQAAMEEAHAADAAAEFAKNDLDRLRPLLDRGLISREAFDRARTTYQTSTANMRSARYRVEVAQYELEAARSVLQYSAAVDTGTPDERVPVRSPVTGKILKVNKECEGPVSTGEPLVELGDTTILEVEVDVLSADAVRIKPGMQVVFERWGGEGVLHGIVKTIEPVGFTKISALGVEEQRVLVIVDFISPPEQWQRLGDGYRVDASFILWQEDNVLQVPASSLFRYQDGWAVFVQENGQAARRTVETGHRNSRVAQVLSGVKEGERVIDHPSDDVEDGKRVKRRKLE